MKIVNHMTKRILLADDHGVVRFGLSLLIKKIRPDAIVEEVDDYRKVLDSIAKSSYDLMILDINMPNGNFQETLEIIKLKHPNTKVMVFSSLDESTYAIRYLKMGADGFLHKLSSEEDMSKAVLKMLDKGSYISEDVKESMIFNQLNKSNPHLNPIELLSDREIDVAERMIKGVSLKEISNDLNLHVSTISTYKSRIFKKLAIDSIPELIEVFNFYQINIKL